MNLILVRHGETKESKKGVLLGHLPGHLTIKGKKEMLKIAKGIKKLKQKPKTIFSSDLKRAKDSAKIIAKELNIKIKYNKLLRERRGGVAEGKREDEIDWGKYEKTSLPYRRHKGGESFLDVKKRAEIFLKNLHSKKYKTIIIVSHSVVLAMILSCAKHWSIKRCLQGDFKRLVSIEI